MNYAFVSFAAKPSAASQGELTPAEQKVVALIKQGLSDRDIAEKRGTSPRTVANQIASVFRKLGVHSRHELIAKG